VPTKHSFDKWGSVLTFGAQLGRDRVGAAAQGRPGESAPSDGGANRTSVNSKGIEQRLRTGSWSHVSNPLAREEAKKCKEPGLTAILCGRRL